MDPAFSDEELSIIHTIRSHEIRVVNGKLIVWFPVSDECAAKCLHDLTHGKPIGTIK